MNAVVEARGLGKRYRRRWALTDCTLAIPPGRVVGLVGPNGAGKTTLLQLAAGLLAPTAGTIEVMGKRPGAPAQLRAVGFVAQDTPTYAGLSVAGHLRMGGWLNPGWDNELAERRVRQLGLDPRQRAGSLSGGQRAQLALTLAVAKRPELLLLDEPVASLDPLARREFLRGLMETVAEHGVSVVLSSHLIADVERVCDYLVVLTGSRVRVAEERSSTRPGRSGRSDVRKVEGQDETGHAFARYFTALRGDLSLAAAPRIRQPDPEVMFQEIIYDGLLGDRFLRSFIVTYDLPRSRMIFAPPPPPPTHRNPTPADTHQPPPTHWPH